MKRTTIAAALLAIATSALPAYAGPVVQLSAAATAKAVNDEMAVEFAVVRTGPQVAALNKEVLALAHSALAKAAKRADVKAKLAGIHTHANWNARGKPEGWTVRATVRLQSRDFEALGDLSGLLAQELQLAGVQFRLSSDARAKVERELLADAAAAFSQKSSDVAAAFGYTSATPKELAINQSFHAFSPRHARPPMAMMAESADAAISVPTEGGESDVTVTVSGSVELN